MATITTQVISGRAKVKETDAYKEASGIQKSMLKNRSSILSINEAVRSVETNGWKAWNDATTMNGQRWAVVKELTNN